MLHFIGRGKGIYGEIWGIRASQQSLQKLDAVPVFLSEISVRLFLGFWALFPIKNKAMQLLFFVRPVWIFPVRTRRTSIIRRRNMPLQSGSFVSGGMRREAEGRKIDFHWNFILMEIWKMFFPVSLITISNERARWLSMELFFDWLLREKVVIDGCPQFYWYTDCVCKSVRWASCSSVPLERFVVVFHPMSP